VTRPAPAECAANFTPQVPAAPPARSAPPVAPLPAPGLPEYFVSPCGPLASPWLVVGSTRTGAPLAAISLPRGWAPADGHVSDGALAFLIDAVPGDRPAGPDAQRWYLLRITPGQPVTATLARVPVTIPGTATGVALSPDGTAIAIATLSPANGMPPTAPDRGPWPAIALYSVATGDLLRRWQAASGEIVAGPDDQHASDDKAMTLRWTADGSRLAFTWNGASIRLLNAAPTGTRPSGRRSSPRPAGRWTCSAPCATGASPRCRPRETPG
jgi:WD40 repeat protein